MKAIYCLDGASFGKIYGESERSAISELVEIIGPARTAEEVTSKPQLLENIDLIFSGWGAPVLTKEILDCAPNLKAVLYGAGSVKYMLTEAFWERKILITSAYAANAVPVVEYTLSQILFALRSGWQHVLKLRQDKAYSLLPMASGYGSTVGLVSLGMIGKMVVERLKTFDVNIIAYDPFVTTYPGVEMVKLDELFRRADVVSLHTPWLKETEGLIGGELIGSMKPYATFLNTSRGAVVCENEMIDVLSRRSDLTAVLDVVYPEPPAADSALFTLPNVILTPHIAGSNGLECRRMGQVMVEELKRYLAGEPFRYNLTREKVAVMA
jgi:phosphoglycerate dehydrogenase-like enzyme